MLTRLKVSGFKNLVDVDVRFGPFTCIAGANGVGKSNLFDAIQFLSALAHLPLLEAAMTVRGSGERSADVRSLFYRSVDGYDTRMSFGAEMIIPPLGSDDLGQEAEASITFLRYELEIGFISGSRADDPGELRILREELTPLRVTEAKRNLMFPHKKPWRDSVITGRRSSSFISTEEGAPDGGPEVRLHQDGGSRGRPLKYRAEGMKRTILSSTNAAEAPTALLTKKEMLSWRLLHLEPSAMREPDEFMAPASLTSDGSHLPRTLYRMNHPRGSSDPSGETSPDVYDQVADRLRDLLDDVEQVNVDRDEKRQLFTLQVTTRDGVTYPARSLSDGTLRFLALAVIVLDREATGLLCLEEPENGLHPARIPAMLNLLFDLATDTTLPVGLDNPLRQILVNTHSPAVVAQVSGDDLLLAKVVRVAGPSGRIPQVRFTSAANTWRTVNLSPDETLLVSSPGHFLDYLNPIFPREADRRNGSSQSSSRRLMDREEFQFMLPLMAENKEP